MRLQNALLLSFRHRPVLTENAGLSRGERTERPDVMAGPVAKKWIPYGRRVPIDTPLDRSYGVNSSARPAGNTRQEDGTREEADGYPRAHSPKKRLHQLEPRGRAHELAAWGEGATLTLEEASAIAFGGPLEMPPA